MKQIIALIVLALVLWGGEVSAERSAVSANKTNVRSGPGTNHEILWSVPKYYPVDIVKISGSWRKIRDFEGDEGWIHSSLLRKIPSVIVKVPLANIREKPGTNSRISLQAEKGVSFKRLRQQGKWLKVQHVDGEVGWIHKSLVW
jgi:SH3-like domain-containing protein